MESFVYSRTNDQEVITLGMQSELEFSNIRKNRFWILCKIPATASMPKQVLNLQPELAKFVSLSRSYSRITRPSFVLLLDCKSLRSVDGFENSEI